MATALELPAAEELQPQPAGTPGLGRILWRYKFVILLGLALGLGVGWLYSGQQPVYYQASAQVLVVKKRADQGMMSPDGRPLMVEDYLATHQILMRSPKIVSEAVKKHNLGALRSFQGNGDPTGTITSNLRVTREMGDYRGSSSVLTLTFTSSYPEDCGKVINAVIDSYIDFLDARYQDVSKDAVKYISDAKDKLELGVGEKKAKLRKFHHDNPQLWLSKEGQSPAQERYQRLKDKVELVAEQQNDLQLKLLMLNIRQQDVKKHRAVVASAGGIVADTAERESKNNKTNLERLALEYLEGFSTQDKQKLDELKNEIRKLKYQEKKYLDAGWGPNSDYVKQVRSEIEHLKQEVEVVESAAGPLLDKNVDVAAYCKGELTRRLENKKDEARLLEQPLKEAESRVKGQKVLEEEEANLKKSIEDESQLYYEVVKQLQKINNMVDAGGGFQADRISPAGPGSMVVPRNTRSMLLGGILGLLIGCGLAYLAYLTDHSFRTPEEIRYRLGVPLIGHIPSFGDGADKQARVEALPLDKSLLTFYRTKSREAEAYRGVRTALFFSARGGQRVIQVTSPDMGDGKTTLAANLAVSVAQSEKKTLLIDADLRRPRIAALFGLDNDRGLTSYLAGEANVDDLIRKSGVTGLHLLTTGPIPPNPAELLSLPRFKELLISLKTQYDFIIIDTPPLLAVTDPCAVVPHVDAVLLTLRLSKTARPHATRAREILKTLDARVIGVVVNGVGGDGMPGYGYTAYNYGYGNGYDYGYGYGAYGNNDSYYGSEGTSEERKCARVEAVAHANGNGHENGKTNGDAVHHIRKRQPPAKKGFLSWLFNR
jgi:capsular exopolysaccharide synthesis family protein